MVQVQVLFLFILHFPFRAVCNLTVVYRKESILLVGDLCVQRMCNSSLPQQFLHSFQLPVYTGTVHCHSVVKTRFSGFALGFLVLLHGFCCMVFLLLYCY